MSTNYGPRIINSGLSLHLDGADRNSYPGNGTIWYDLSGNGNNGTLTNGPVFSTSNRGIITLDGVDDYVVLNGGSALNNWNPDGINASTSYRSYTSANIWIRPATISTAGATKFIFTDNFGVEYGFYQIDSTLYGVGIGSRSTTVSANTWYNACITADIGRPATGTYSQTGTTTITCTTTYPVTFNSGDTVFLNFTKTGGPDAVPTSQNYVVTVTGASTFTVVSAVAATSNGTIIYASSTNQSTVTFYINGNLIGTNTANTPNGANDAPFNLGRDNGPATGYWNGSISSIQLYNRTLSASDVSQNFNAMRGRFGL